MNQTTDKTSKPTRTLRQLEDSIDEALKRLGDQDPLAFRRLAEDTLIHAIPRAKLLNIRNDQDEIQTQATRVAKHFMIMYGTAVWGAPKRAIRKAEQLRHDLKSEIPENKQAS